MILGAEIGLLVYGIIAMVRLKFSMGKRGDVTGWRAAVLGLICVGVIPMVLMIGFGIGVFYAVQNIEATPMAFAWIDIAALVLAFIAVSVLGRIYLAQQAAQSAAGASYPGSQAVPHDPSNPYAPTQRPQNYQ